MDEAYRLEEGKTGEYTVIFNNEFMGRGYEINLKKGNINLSMPLPTSDDEIKFFYAYIKELATKFKAKTFVREEEEVTFDKLETFIEMDKKTSEGALKQIEENIDSGKYKNMYIFGAINPIALGKKELTKIDGDLKKLGKLMSTLQKMDVYYAKANLYQKKDQSLFGVYIITEDVPSVLPYEAKIFMDSENRKVDEWNIGFICKEKLVGFVSFDNFLSFVKKKEEYDTEHFIVTLNEKTIKELISKYKVEI